MTALCFDTPLAPAPPPPQAKGKTSEALTKLCQLAPPTATLLELDGSGAVVGEREVLTDLVHRGDVLKVLPGARMPTDGVVLEGASYADESMLTGESGEAAGGERGGGALAPCSVLGWALAPLLARGRRSLLAAAGGRPG